MVVAVIAVGMVQASVHQVVRVIGMRHRFVSTAWTMLVRAARLRRAMHGVCRVRRNNMLVDMVPVNMMQMAVVQIIDMAAMANRCVPAVRAMLVSMVGVLLLGTRCHCDTSLSSVAFKWPSLFGSVFQGILNEPQNMGV